jgi:hypothetical protein
VHQSLAVAVAVVDHTPARAGRREAAAVARVEQVVTMMVPLALPILVAAVAVVVAAQQRATQTMVVPVAPAW